MDYKWNIYTCDVEANVNMRYKKWFKWIDNWEYRKESITKQCETGMRDTTFRFVIANSKEDAVEKLYNRYVKTHKWLTFDMNNGYMRRETKDFRLCEPQIVQLSINTLLKHYDSESVIEWLKERGISTVMAK